MKDAPSRTAEAVCFLRAADQRRPPETRVLDDPYAKLFLGPSFRAALAGVEVSGRLGERLEERFSGLTNLGTYVLARHRFIDDALLAALDREPAPAQVLLLGAGYDTRAYRFADRLRGARLFEVDHPSTGQRKARLVAENAEALPDAPVQAVSVDFEVDQLDDRLLQAGFERGALSFLVWEGVSMYLTRRAVQGTLTVLRTLVAPGSELVMDFWYLLDAPDLVATAHRASANLLHFLGEPITFGIHPEDVVGFLERLGWEACDVAEAPELARRYVRDGRSVYPANYAVRARAT